MQTQHDDGTWVLEVAYRPHGKLSSMIDSFPADRVRDDMIDRSHGRAVVHHELLSSIAASCL